MFGQEKVEIGFANHLGGISQLENFGQRRVDPDEAALLVFEVNMVGDVIHQSADEEPLLLQRLVALQQLAIEPPVAFINPP